MHNRRSTIRKRKGFTPPLGGTGFTLIELLVVIAIIALLMAVLMPSLNRAKKQAKAVACQAQLKQWGLCFSMYADDNNGQFIYGAHSGQWRWMLNLYNIQGSLSFCCPAASDPDKPRGKFGTWGGGGLVSGDADYVMQGDYGSYGINRWTYNRKKSQSDKGYWRATNVKEAGQIPVFMDCAFYGARPVCTHPPPLYDGDLSGFPANMMKRFCIDRHNGTINGLFMDWSVRKVGLKELWVLKWHRDYETGGPWTRAGGCRPSDWPEWMRKFKDY
ncbi:MAG: type II secretion system protein [Sedimentisphaerales bacterium]